MNSILETFQADATAHALPVPAAQTLFVQIVAGGGGDGPEPDQFTPWNIGAGDAETCRDAAIEKHLRERGTRKDSREYVFTVFTYTDTAPTWPNGRPRRVTCLTMKSNPGNLNPGF